MPTSYTMPSIPNRYPLDKNDKLGLLIGTLLSSGLAAAGSKNTGESPWLRGVAGATAGFGVGGKAINDSYSAMLDDYLKNEVMDFRNRQLTQEQQQFQDTLGLNREKFGEEKRQFEESTKPFMEARTNVLNTRQPNTPSWLQKIQFRESSPENETAYDETFHRKSNAKEPDYLSKMTQIDSRIANLESKDPSQSNPRIQASINSLRNIRAQYHTKLYGSETGVKNLDFNFNTQMQTPISGTVLKPLDETTAMQFLNQANGDKDKARELARRNGYEF